METEKTELGKRSYKSGILRKKFCYLFLWEANKNSRLGIEIIGGKDILPLECFGIQGCLERERDRERQYGNLSFLWTWNACWVGKCVEWPLRELGWACIICQPKNIRHLLPKKNIRHLDEVLFSV